MSNWRHCGGRCYSDHHCDCHKRWLNRWLTLLAMDREDIQHILACVWFFFNNCWEWMVVAQRVFICFMRLNKPPNIRCNAFVGGQRGWALYFTLSMYYFIESGMPTMRTIHRSARWGNLWHSLVWRWCWSNIRMQNGILLINSRTCQLGLPILCGRQLLDELLTVGYKIWVYK